MLKKMLSVFLCLTLAVTTVMVAPLTSAGAVAAKQWVQDFENYNPTNVSILNNTMELVTLPDTVPVRTGSSGRMAIKATVNKGETKFVCLFPGDDTAKFAAEKTYTVSCWVYVAQKDTTSCNLVLRGLTVNNQGFENGYKVLHNELPPVVGEWKNLSYTFTPDRDSYLSFSSNVWGDGLLELYIDDFTVTEVPDSVTVTYVSGTSEAIAADTSAPGDALTLPTPTENIPGYVFGGWADESGQLYSKTVYPSTDLTLTAVWAEPQTWTQNYEGEAPTLHTANNSASIAVGTAHSGEKSLHFAADTAGGNHIAALGSATDNIKVRQGRTYEITMWTKSTVAITLNATYQTVPTGLYDNTRVKLDNGSNTPAVAVANVAISTDWIKTSKTITAAYDGYLTLASYSLDAAYDLYIDDITVAERPATVAISYVSSTGETPDSAVGAPGDSVTHPTPSIEKAGYSFVGWYDADGNACTVYPNSNITLYAAWSRDVWTQDFSDYDGTGIGANGMEVVDLPAELPQKEGASGGKALHYSGNAVKFQYLFPGNRQAQLEAEKKYIIAYDVYVASATDTVQLALKASSTYGAAYMNDQVTVPNSVYQIQAADAGKWIHVYRETTGVAGYLSITNFMKGVTGEFYVDDFTVTEIIDLETAKENKAAIRLAGNTEGGVGKQGLRVYNKINSSLTANKTIVEYGTLAIRYGRVAPNTVIDVNTAGIVKGVAYDSAAGINKVWSEDPDGIVFTAYLTGIKTEFYGSDYAVRTYAKDSDGNYYYGDQFTLCVYDVVAAIQASDSASAADTETAETIIAEDPTAYTQWMNKQ